MNDLLLEIPTEYDEEILIPPVWYVIDKVVWVQKILISRQYKLFEYFFWSLCNTLYSRGIFLTESLRGPGARIRWSDDEVWTQKWEMYQTKDNIGSAAIWKEKQSFPSHLKPQRNWKIDVQQSRLKLGRIGLK